MNTKTEQLILSHLPNLKEITAKLSKFQNNNITLKKVVYFLLQFEDPERIAIVIRLLTHFELLDGPRLVALVLKAMKQVTPQLRENALYCALGAAQDSCANLGYALGKELFTDEKMAQEKMCDINRLGEQLERQDLAAIICYDDNITSGTQLDDLFAELIEGKTPREMVQHALTPDQVQRLRSLPIRICYAVQLSSVATARVATIADKYQLDLEIFCGKHDLDNQIEFGAGLLQSKAEEDFAVSFLKEIARPLYADKSNWTDDKKEDRLLGYGNLGKLTAFYYNIPKALLPVFWKSGIVKGKPWIPLLPEYKVGIQMREGHIRPDETWEWIAQAILDKNPVSKMPIMDFGFDVDGNLVNEITIQIPSARWLQEQILDRLLLKDHQYEEQFIKDAHEADFWDKNSLYGLPPRNPTFLNYKNAVEDYNLKLDVYRAEVAIMIFRFASKFPIRIRVVNKGTAAASHATLETSINSSTLIIDRFDTIKQPEFKLPAPRWEAYKNNPHNIQPILIKSPVLLSGIFKERPPCEWDRVYTDTLFKSDIVRHTDAFSQSSEFVRIDTIAQLITLPCILKYTEMNDPIEKNLIIHYQEMDDVTEELKEEVFTYYRSFYSKLPTKYL